MYDKNRILFENLKYIIKKTNVIDKNTNKNFSGENIFFLLFIFILLISFLLKFLEIYEKILKNIILEMIYF